MSRGVLTVSAKVGRRANNRKPDVLVVQAALRSLRGREGGKPYYTGPIDGRVGTRTVDAIAAFQTDRRIKSDAVIAPNSQSLRRMSVELERSLPATPQSKKPFLTFDGHSLCWRGRPFEGKCWAGVSGAIGFQDKEHQSVEDKGPVPEGRWHVRQVRYQRFDDIPLEYRLLYRFIPRAPVGTWPGGTRSWGRNRVWLEPKPGTETFGRTDFSIHGGEEPGSAGCVDLTSQMPDFVRHFRAYGVDLDLVVEYN